MDKELLLKDFCIKENENQNNIPNRDGIELEKGAVLTEDYLQKNRKEIEKIMSLFSVYPDLFLDIITPVDSNFSLFFYQRIVIRAIMRYKEIFATAPRALRF